MNQNNQRWRPNPSELERPGPINNLDSVSLMGVLSNLVGSFLLATHVFLLWHLHSMSLQTRELSAVALGEDIIGIPLAVVLGLLSWRTRNGAMGLVIIGVVLLLAVYTFLFGLPLSLVLGAGR